MSREVDDFFDEIDTKIPDDISRLVGKQMDIAEAIARTIEKGEFKTRKAFAGAIGMKESMLSRILAGNVNLTLRTITKIEAALKTDIISVVEFEMEEEQKFEVASEYVSVMAELPIVEPSKSYDKIWNFILSKEIHSTNFETTNDLGITAHA